MKKKMETSVQGIGVRFQGMERTCIRLDSCKLHMGQQGYIAVFPAEYH